MNGWPLQHNFRQESLVQKHNLKSNRKQEQAAATDLGSSIWT